MDKRNSLKDLQERKNPLPVSRIKPLFLCYRYEFVHVFSGVIVYAQK